MNSITRSNDLYTYHIFKNVEFSGVLDKCFENSYGRHYVCDYHIFIKYGDKVYMDVKGVGDIIISFEELQKNKYWKYYYDLSLMLTNNKNLVIEDIEYSSYYVDFHKIYTEKRVWCINTSYIDGDCSDFTTKNVVDNEYNCYCNINPYDLEKKDYSPLQYLKIFKEEYMLRCKVRNNNFDKKSAYYYALVLDYWLNLIEKELEELEAIFEDKKNLIILVTLNEIEGMNGDLLRIIYNNLVSGLSSISDKYKNKYSEYVDELCDKEKTYARSQKIAMRILCA